MRSLDVCGVARKYVCVCVCGLSTRDVVDAVWLQGCRVQQLFRGRLSYNGCLLAIRSGVVRY